jgi:hypothetical protein
METETPSLRCRRPAWLEGIRLTIILPPPKTFARIFARMHSRIQRMNQQNRPDALRCYFFFELSPIPTDGGEFIQSKTNNAVAVDHLEVLREGP